MWEPGTEENNRLPRFRVGPATSRTQTGSVASLFNPTHWKLKEFFPERKNTLNLMSVKR